MDYELLKYRGGFFLGLLITVAIIVFSNLNKDYGLRAWDYKPSRIEKVIITRAKDKSIITITDSSNYKPLLRNIINSIRVRNVESRSSDRVYEISIHYDDSGKHTIQYYLSNKNIFYFNVYNTYYVNDSLNKELSKIEFLFPEVIIKNDVIVF